MPSLRMASRRTNPNRPPKVGIPYVRPAVKAKPPIVSMDRIKAATKIHDSGGFDYVDVGLLGLEHNELTSLHAFMAGQTMPLLPGVHAVYTEDLVRWSHHRGIID